MIALRQCTQCGLKAFTKDDLVKAFSPNKQCKHGYANQCLDCRRKVGLKSYHKHKESVLLRGSQKRRDTRDKILKYLGGQCSHCGIEYTGDNAVIFDLHHTDPSEKDFSVSKHSGRNFEKLKPEVDKCVLLCANCHRLEHKQETLS